MSAVIRKLLSYPFCVLLWCRLNKPKSWDEAHSKTVQPRFQKKKKKLNLITYEYPKKKRTLLYLKNCKKLKKPPEMFRITQVHL